MKQLPQPVADTLTLATSEPDDLVALPEGRALRIYFLMRMINAFERRVVELKKSDCVWGPIHISIGQEAVAAASIAALEPGDRIAGSHRAHHIFLAKAFEHVLPSEWDPASGDMPEEAQEVIDRTLAEIMGLEPGYCGGRGGSMHLRWTDAGVLGTNAIVAGGVPLATGAAMAEQYRATGRVVVCYLGDGAVNQGCFHEACNLAGLWNLPILYVIENNQYAVATSTREACAVDNLARHALSCNLIGRSAWGYDPVAIYHTVRELTGAMRTGGRPAILELRCYRHLHHGGDLAGSAYGYRDKDEEESWRSKDALETFPEALIAAELSDRNAIDSADGLAEAAAELAIDFCAVPVEGDAADGRSFAVREELWPSPASVELGVRSSGDELSGLRYLEFGEVTEVSEFRELKFSDAIAAVTGRWLERDPETVVLGEEVANFGGGAYGATRGLPAQYPDRVRNTPISEAGFSGVGLGLAMSGMRPVVEIMFPDFTLVAADQIFNQIAKARHMFGGTTDLPLVLRMRIATGCGYGGQHSMDPVGLYALFPGWRIIAPADACDYIGLFNTAMHSLDPVAILEYHSLYDLEMPIPSDDLDYCVRLGAAKVVVEGTELTVLTYGAMTRRVMAVAPAGVEIIDLRTLDLANVDFRTIGASLAKTGQIAIFEQAAGGQSIGRRIASEVTERFFDELDGPPGVFTSLDIPNSVSRILEAEALLDDETITRAIDAMISRRWK